WKIAALGIVAVGLVCISGSIASGAMSLTGLLIASLSALLYASLIVFNKRIVRTGGLQTAAIELDVAFVVVLVYVLLTSGLPRPVRAELPYVVLIGLVNTALAYLLYFTGLQKLPASSVALLSYADPVSALLFAALLLHESMTSLQLFGAVLILGGAILGELRQR
ncbi:MAG: DMT family transporter, partial [Oscillospiraceae bacterium]|nr:DMT family transporter [Oscillospiraceae bacterium]